MELHPEIKKFIEKKIEPDNLYLPHNYPEVSTFREFQQGYKYIEDTGETLTGTKSSDFKESWYVICSNEMSDPFYVDLSEQDQGFPVYFSWHSAGSWIPVKIADDLNDFTAKLLSIEKVDQDKAKLLRLLKKNFDLTIELWKEIYTSIEEEEQGNVEETDTDSSEWIRGKVLIRDIGQQKMKIVHYLKEHFKLTPQQALALSKQKDIEVDQGHLLYLKGLVNHLKELGATAEFVADKK